VPHRQADLIGFRSAEVDEQVERLSPTGARQHPLISQLAKSALSRPYCGSCLG
jgi:hypothetical protein